jgi:predicted ATPase/class 3 adenylate cyclase
MAELPTGTVTFLFTDIERSTELLTALGERFGDVLDRHHLLLREACAGSGGVEVSTEGDAFFVVFSNPAAAVRAATDAQRALQAEPWPENGAVRVRMGLHTGEGLIGGDNYVGLDVHRASRIASAAHGGQILISDATRALVEQSLPAGAAVRDLGRHRLKGLPSAERIYQLVVEGLTSEFPPISSLDVRPHNLPAALTSFVGRERQIAEIGEQLRRTRLLTLTGPGGTGKTRLSMRVAEEVLLDYEHGCWFVELDALRDAELVPGTIAGTLGVKVPADSSPTSALQAWLADRQLLLVLDNFEQVAEAAPICPALLGAAPGLRILVTSRTPLHVYGEHEYAVPPLASASELRSRAQREPETLSQYEAVRLFIERAVAVKPDFRVTNENAPAVAEICARLDGLPLAIELAAARVKLLSPADMLSRLDQNLSLLSSSAVDLPERQRTLRGAIDWSHELLSDPEQRLFARLSTFRGGFTLDAAEAVCADERLGIDVLDGVASLVDHSLLRNEESGSGTRFGMLETIGEYARERLDQLPDAQDVFRRHAVHYFELCHQAADQLTGQENARWLDRLELEQDNLRAAFSRAPDLGLLNGALVAAGSIWRFWHLRGQLAEGRATLERLLSGEEAEAGARAIASTAAGGLAYWQMDYEAMGRHYREARQLYESLGDAGLLARALYNESYIFLVAGDFAGGRSALERAARLYGQIGDELGAAETEMAIGFAHFMNADIAEAQQRVERAVEMYRSAGETWHLADTLTAVGYLHGTLGDWPPAIAALRESMEIFAEMGSEMGLSMAFESTASAAAWVGDLDRAARLFGKADEIRARLGGGPPLRLFLSGVFREKAVAEIGEDFERLHSLGQAMTTAEGVELVRGFQAPDGSPPLPRLGPDSD